MSGLDSKVFEHIQEAAVRDGAEVELLIETQMSLDLSAHQGDLDKFNSGHSRSAGLRVIKNGSPGYAYSEDLSEKALLRTYRDALQNAEFISEHRDQSEPPMELVKSAQPLPVLNAAPLAAPDLPIEKKIDLALAIEKSALDFNSVIKSVPYNGYHEVWREVEIFNSKGVHGRFHKRAISAYAYAAASKDETETKEGWYSSYVSDPRVIDPQKIGKIAAERAAAKLGSQTPATGNYAVIFNSEVAGTFLGLLIDYFSAKSVSQGTSLFAQDHDKQIASDVLTILDDPFIENGVASRPFDSEGTPAQKTTILENGRLKNFLTNSFYARKLGLPLTGHASRSSKSELGIGPSNWVIKKGDKSLAELLASEPKVILINMITGLHSGFSEGSGTFSLQSQGELYENGKRVGPLSQFVISGDVKTVLKQIKAVSNTEPDAGEQVLCPDLLIGELSVAGK